MFQERSSPQSTRRKEPPQEQLEFLKREEVRTMAKDVAQLREEEAKKERERIAKIKAEPAESPKGIRAGPPQSNKVGLGGEPKPSLMPHAQEQKPVFLKARTRSEKIIIRVIVIGVLLFILLNGLAFGYWYFIKKRVGEIVPATQPTPVVKVEEPNVPLIEPERPLAPAPVFFFDTAQEKTIEVAAADNLLLLLSGALKEEDSKESSQGFTRILLQNTGNTTFLTTREFLNKAAVAMPEPLLSLLKEDFMLFVYSSPGRKRLGMIAELAMTESAENLLKAWETTLEQDTKQLWDIVGQKGGAYAPFFRQAVHQNNLVRFQTFSVFDFGVVYTLFGSKLILATSFESLTKAVDLLIQNR